MNKELMRRFATIQNLQREYEEPSYRCPKCKDNGIIIFKNDNGLSMSKDCECKKLRDNERRFALTALGSQKDKYTIANFETTEEWQKDILYKAKEYVKEFKDNWFYIGGQVGSGKTHICTAIVQNLSYMYGLSFDYILFNKKITELKQDKFENKEKYIDEMNKLYNTDLLFIDDLFKIEPSRADLDILFDIINERYLSNKPCIISSEKLTQELVQIDEAIASRIIEKCKSFNLGIGKNMNRNYRLK